MTGRALSFGAAASAYERFRPGYPDELVDQVLDYAGQPVTSALEIGAGTGKATRAFAARGVVVTATEPDSAMIAELRRHVPPSVVAVQAAFEDLPPAGVYDLVFAAASLHWTSSDRRPSRIAGMLKRGAVFASFGGPMHLADPAVEAAVYAARSKWLASDNTVYLSPEHRGFPADERCAAVLGMFDLVDGHFPFDDSRVGAVGSGGEQLGEDFVGDGVAGVGEGVRGKNPGGWRWFAVRPGGIW